MVKEALSRRSLLSAGAALWPSFTTLGQTRPINVVLVLCDDLGYGDLGCYGSSLRTPHLDRFAREGTQFESFTSASPVCSPSRAGLLTGRYPTRVGVPRVLFPQDNEGLALDETTLASALKQQGYRTACIGKWHLGHTSAYLPTARGFDRYLGIPYSNDMEPRPLMEGCEVIENPASLETLTQRYTEAAVRFVEDRDRRPFFLYLAHNMPHIPLAASKAFQGRSPAGLYGDVIEELDWSTGQILAALSRRGLDDSTLVMFTSDNGPWYQGSPGRLRGRKGSTFEGGMRVPLLARLPGRFPVGGRTRFAASALDVFPTIADITGCRSAKPIDGVSLLPLFSGKQNMPSRREPLLYFSGWDLHCARWGRWKLHMARPNTEVYTPAPAVGRVNLPLQPPELYDLDSDPDESFDVSVLHPQVVQEIVRMVDSALKTFPDPVQQSWAATRSRRTQSAPAGSWPRQAR